MIVANNIPPLRSGTFRISGASAKVGELWLDADNNGYVSTFFVSKSPAARRRLVYLKNK